MPRAQPQPQGPHNTNLFSLQSKGTHVALGPWGSLNALVRGSEKSVHGVTQAATGPRLHAAQPSGGLFRPSIEALPVLKYREKATYIESRRALAARQARVPRLPLGGGRRIWWSSAVALAHPSPSQERPTPEEALVPARWLGVHGHLGLGKKRLLPFPPPPKRPGLPTRGPCLPMSGEVLGFACGPAPRTMCPGPRPFPRTGGYLHAVHTVDAALALLTLRGAKAKGSDEGQTATHPWGRTRVPTATLTL